MNAFTIRSALLPAAVVAALAGAAQAAELTIYKQPNFSGGSLTLNRDTSNLGNSGFQDQASSLIVRSGRWQLCSQPDFRGDCVTVGRGEYGTLDPVLNHRIESAREIVNSAQDERGGRYRDDRYASDDRGRHDGAREHYGPRTNVGIELFSDPGFRGYSTEFRRDADELGGYDRHASSLVVYEGRWQVCSAPGYEGRCRVYEPGRYPTLGRTTQVGSLRRVG